MAVIFVHHDTASLWKFPFIIVKSQAHKVAQSERLCIIISPFLTDQVRYTNVKYISIMSDKGETLNCDAAI